MPFLCPRERFCRVSDLSAEELHRMGVKALLLDVDNTLSLHHAKAPFDDVPAWLDTMKEQGITLCVVSNSKRNRVAPFAESLGLDFIWSAAKPLPFGIRKALRRYHLKGHEAALVGDQLLTDALGAKLAGVKIVLVKYRKLEPGFGFWLKRKIEAPLLKGKPFRGEEE